MKKLELDQRWYLDLTITLTSSQVEVDEPGTNWMRFWEFSFPETSAVLLLPPRMETYLPVSASRWRRDTGFFLRRKDIGGKTVDDEWTPVPKIDFRNKIIYGEAEGLSEKYTSGDDWRVGMWLCRPGLKNEEDGNWLVKTLRAFCLAKRSFNAFQNIGYWSFVWIESPLGFWMNQSLFDPTLHTIAFLGNWYNTSLGFKVRTRWTLERHFTIGTFWKRISWREKNREHFNAYHFL